MAELGPTILKTRYNMRSKGKEIFLLLGQNLNLFYLYLLIFHYNER